MIGKNEIGKTARHVPSSYSRANEIPKGGVGMRRVLFAVFLAAVGLTPDLHGQSAGVDAILPSIRVPSALQPCDIHGIVQALGRLTRVPLGFEGGAECAANVLGGWLVDQPFSSAPDAADWRGLSLAQALDRAVAQAPAYQWKETHGMVVVRPRAAWDDPADPINQSIEPFRVDDERLPQALDIMLARPPSTAAAPGLLNEVRRNIAFGGGSVLFGLNMLTLTYRAAGWDAAVVNEAPDGYGPGPLLAIVFRANDHPRGAAIQTTIPVGKLGR
jgi:hypothetical protein